MPPAQPMNCHLCQRQIGKARTHFVTESGPVVCSRCLEDRRTHGQLYPGCTIRWHGPQDHGVTHASAAYVRRHPGVTLIVPPFGIPVAVIVCVGPVLADVHHVGRGGGHVITVRCPLCGQKHHHEWDDGEGDPGIRESTCDRGRYFIPAPFGRVAVPGFCDALLRDGRRCARRVGRRGSPATPTDDRGRRQAPAREGADDS